MECGEKIFEVITGSVLSMLTFHLGLAGGKAKTHTSATPSDLNTLPDSCCSGKSSTVTSTLKYILQTWRVNEKYQMLKIFFFFSGKEIIILIVQFKLSTKVQCILF